MTLEDETSNAVHEQVQHYYGEVLQNSNDLQTDACCTIDNMPAFIRPLLADIHPEVLSKYYGCGLVLPDLLTGMRILDLGSGSGRDCYVLSRLVGAQGRVVGVDMTDQQLAVAKRHIDFHTLKYGYSKPNVAFYKGDIEKLDELGFAEESYDLVVSNCVINLTRDKAAVLEQAYRLLKPGGEMYFSDVYADRRVPNALTKDPVLHGECLAGAMYWNDFQNLAKKSGFLDPRIVESHPLNIENPVLEEKLGKLRFYSATYRLFKIAELETSCEDYGQAVRYLGTIPNYQYEMVLDNHHAMQTGKLFPVCGNTWQMLRQTRYRDHFEFYGDWSNHYGIFEGCGVSIPFDSEGKETSGACC